MPSVTDPKDWAYQKNNNVRGFYIDVESTRIFVGCDPLDGMTNSGAKTFDVWINVADSPCNTFFPTSNKPRMYWYPIQELSFWGYGPFYWIKRILDFHVLEKPVNKIYLHCHAGANRSPTVLFYWLLSRVGWRQAAKMMRPGKREYKKNNSYYYIDSEGKKWGCMWGGIPDHEREWVNEEGRTCYKDGPNFYWETPWRREVIWRLHQIKMGYVPRRLDVFFKIMEEHPTWSLDSIQMEMLHQMKESGEYHESMGRFIIDN